MSEVERKMSGMHVWGKPVGAAGHPQKVEQAMFGPPIPGPSSIGDE